MASLYSKAKFRLIAMKYRGRGDVVVQTRYMGCQMLVRANEDVGQLIMSGIYENDDITYFLGKLADGDTFFDVGANIGLFSLLCAHKRASTSVHAFEPIPLNASLFEASIHLNGFENISLNRICVGNDDGEQELTLASDSAYSSLISTDRKATVRRLRTYVTTLDSYVAYAGIPRIDLMKVDVEGAEMMVLEGARGLLSDAQRRPRLVLIELFDQNLKPFGTSITRIVEFMSRLGYCGLVLENGQTRRLMPRHYNRIYNAFFELDTR